MNGFRALQITVLITLFIPLSRTAQSQTTPDLDKVLRRMDAASVRFKSAEADFKWDQYERILGDTSSQSGTIYFQRRGGSTDMGAQITAPTPKTLVYTGETLQLYDPSIDRITVLSPGNNRSQYESLLTLGFGGSGRDLEKTWGITYQGNETIKDGNAVIQTAKLDIVPKDPGLKKMVTHLIIWVDPDRGVSPRQHFFMPSGDERSSFFSNIRYNQPVDAKKYAIRKSSKTTIVKH
jgi:outer membrane lipoprotein-sorting protein